MARITKMSGSVKLRWIIGAGLLAGALLLLATAAHVPGFAQWYAITIYPVYMGSLGRLTGLVPFSVVEILLYVFILSITGSVVYTAVRMVRQRTIKPAGRWLSGMLLIAGGLLFWYALGCGINYHRTSFAAEAGYGMAGYTVEELLETCRWLTQKVNDLSDDMVRDENGLMVLEDGTGKAAAQTMSALGKQFDSLSGFYPSPKPVAVSEILSYQSLSGIYSPFTAEANYNADMVAYNIPFTMCHELSHLKGYMEEQEANFIAFLACIGAERMDFQYSGYLLAWIYCTNTLFETDPLLWLDVRTELSDHVLDDISANSNFWDAYDGSISEISDWLNDTYLKANGQPDGVASYDKMVDLVISYYFSSDEK